MVSCVTFGNSGSPLIRDTVGPDGVSRFSWAGALSMSKGQDVTVWLFCLTLSSKAYFTQKKSNYLKQFIQKLQTFLL